MKAKWNCSVVDLGSALLLTAGWLSGLRVLNIGRMCWDIHRLRTACFLQVKR